MEEEARLTEDLKLTELEKLNIAGKHHSRTGLTSHYKQSIFLLNLLFYLYVTVSYLRTAGSLFFFCTVDYNSKNNDHQCSANVDPTINQTSALCNSDLVATRERHSFATGSPSISIIWKLLSATSWKQGIQGHSDLIVMNNGNYYHSTQAF